MFLDEPTTFLDPRHTDEILSILSGLNESGVTIIMVTHEPSLAERADRNIHVRDGQVSLSDPGLHVAAQSA